MEEMFKDVLEKDETILEVLKPNKKKYWWSVNLAFFCSFFWFIFLWFPAFSEKGGWKIVLFGTIITLAAMLIFWIPTYFLCRLNYKNKFYAYSNKRILIRSGIFGVDYKSLEYKSLTATIVNVSFLDKLVKRNTGTLCFGSPSSPMTGLNPYMFRHVVTPYDTMKKIKDVIETKKEGK